MENADYGQLSFQINNKNTNGSVVENTIYTTEDADKNDLTLVIRATVNTTFTQGDIVSMEKAPDGAGSLLYLDLKKLDLKDDEFNNLVFECKGWVFGAPDKDEPIKCMTPDSEDIDLNVGEAINISIKGMAFSQPPSQDDVDLIVTYFHVKDIAKKTSRRYTLFSVRLQNPPEGNIDLQEYLKVEVDQNYILSNNKEGCEPLTNKISLIFSPRKKEAREIIAGDSTAFKVKFTYADGSPGYGALTTIKAAGGFDIKNGVSDSKWEINKVEQAEKLFWVLKPTKGEPILGKGTGSTVEIIIDKIYTEFQPGPTLMLVSYSGLDGYQDGAYWIRLDKIPHVSIEKFSIEPNPARFGKSEGGSDPTAEVTISWKVWDAGSVELKPFDERFTDNEGKIIKKLDGTTPLMLRAYGLGPDNRNVADKNETAKVMPVINSLLAKPSAVYCKDFSRDIKLSWNVDNLKGIKLHSSVTGDDSKTYDHIGNIKTEIYEPQMFTLMPRGDEANLLLRRRIVISAFDILPNNIEMGSPPGFVASSPNAGFMAATIPSKDHLIILDSLGCNEIGDPIGTGKGPQGLAFSLDGSRIFVANSGDGTVSVIEVKPTGYAPAFKFTSVNSIKVGGKPQQLAVSPDGKYIYITVENAEDGSLVILEDKGNGKFSTLLTFPIGPFPRGVAVSPTGAKIFAASSGNNTVSVIGHSSLGGHFLVGSIENLQSKPKGLAVTPDGRTLLVACSEGNKVFGINTENTASARLTFDVGGSPEQIAVAPGGAYAFVTNSGDGTVSLLEYGDKSGVLEKSIKVGKGPNGIAVSSEGGLVFVADQGGSSLTILTLAQYHEETKPKEVGEQPTNIAVAPDGSKALVWHNSAVDFGGNPFTGVYVYERASQTATHLMEGSEIIGCVFSPIPKTNTAFMTQYKKSSITILDTENYSLVGNIPIKKSTKEEDRYPQNLAISADGTRLFALVHNGNSEYSLVVFNTNVGYDMLSDIPIFTSQPTFKYLCVSPDGSKAFAVCSVDSNLWIARRNADGKYTVDKEPIKLGRFPGAVVVTPDGSKVFVLNKGGSKPHSTNSFSVVDTDSLQVKTYNLPYSKSYVSLRDIAISPDGTKIFATDESYPGIKVIDAVSLRFIQTISWDSKVSGPLGIAVLPDGSQIFTANLNSNNIGIIRQVPASRLMSPVFEISNKDKFSRNEKERI
jgi:DNA-binding beta-propeller fold protein YncE